MITTLAFALLLSSQQAVPVEPDEDAVAAIRDVLDLELLDYPSARLRDVRIVTRPSNTYVTLAACGWVNSRTRSGGYAGWKRFVLTNHDIQLEGGEYFDHGWAVWCDGTDVIVVNPDVTDRVSPTPAATN